MRFAAFASLFLFPGLALASSTCNVDGYKPVPGVSVERSGDAVSLTWQGESGQELRARLGIRDGHPLVAELAARQGGGEWIVLGKDLTPEFQVTTVERRMSRTQHDLLIKLGIDTPEQEDRRKWNTFRDAPFNFRGGDSQPLLRSASEIRRGSSEYQTDSCTLTSDRAKVERKTISLTDTTPFGTKFFRTPRMPPVRGGFASPFGIRLEIGRTFSRFNSTNNIPDQTL